MAGDKQRIEKGGQAIEAKKRLASPPPDAAGMMRRVDEALIKEILGEPLSERELAIAQWFRNGEGCASCASLVKRPNIRGEDVYYRRIPIRV